MVMSELTSVLELLMMILFGFSWPINIRKAWIGRTAKGTSVFFYFLIVSGYVCGLIGKFIMIALNAPQPWYVTVRWYVIAIYVLNSIMVSCGIVIWFRNRRLDCAEEDAAQKQK